MMEALTLAGAIVHPILPGRAGPSADIDFFLRPPPWNGGRSKRKIAYFYWEAIPLPAPWAASLNTVDEIWAPCKLVEDCCRMAGFNKKIVRIPTPAVDFDLSKVPTAKFAGLKRTLLFLFNFSMAQ